MSYGTRFPWALLVGALVVVAIAVTYMGSGPVVVVEDPPVAKDCQKTWDWADLNIALQVTPEAEMRAEGAFLSGPGVTQNIPEFHDCQRVLVRDDEKQGQLAYGPVVAIFAVPRDTLRLLPERGGRVEADQRVYEEAGAAGYGLPAAQIYASGGYGPLKINRGVSCLYLVKKRDGTWEANLRSDGWLDRGCRDALRADAMTGPEWGTLDVVVESFSDIMGPGDIPVVARLDWNDTQRTYQVGLWCDYGWCSVGTGTARVSSYYRRHAPPATMPKLRTYDVKAWYDEQILAVDLGNGLEPSEYVGSVFPVEALGEYTQDTFDQGRWVPTAEVSLLPRGQSAGSNPYQAKLNLYETSPAGPFNLISLCNGDGEKCGIREDLARDCETGWWAKVEPAGGVAPEKYGCVTQCPYDVQIPGTVRWRWLEWDPGVWMRCVNGCCELTGVR